MKFDTVIVVSMTVYKLYRSATAYRSQPIRKEVSYMLHVQRPLNVYIKGSLSYIEMDWLSIVYFEPGCSVALTCVGKKN